MLRSVVFLYDRDILASSAKREHVSCDENIEGRSLIYIKNRRGPITEP